MAAALAGVLVWLCAGWLADLYALPRDLLLTIAAVNLLYASGSGSLALRERPPQSLIAMLAVANVVWAVVCLTLAVRHAGTASLFGLGHLLGEALLVGGLACLEWAWRAGAPTARRGLPS